MSGELQQDTQVYNVQIIIGDKPIILDNDNIVSCFFIEDIFKHCMMGKLVFNDVHGFFITPADLKSNNERIFIIVSATRTITFI